MKFEVKIITKSQVYRTIMNEVDLSTMKYRAECTFKDEENTTSTFKHVSEYCISEGDCWVVVPNSSIESIEIRELNDN